MLILLPPSEGKRSPRRGRPLDLGTLSFAGLEPGRAEVAAALVDLCGSCEPAAAARVLGLGPTQVGDVARDARLFELPTARADDVYSGVLYEALALSTLGPAARRRATSWLAVTSGLFGMLRPSDRIPAYRLSGDVSLPGIGPVATYWSRRLDEPVRAAAGRGLVVDLRSSTYAAFWRPAPDLARKVVRLRVLHEVDGTRKVVSHLNKATKGRLVRGLLEDGSTVGTPARLGDLLRDLGWRVEAGPHGQLDVAVEQL